MHIPFFISSLRLISQAYFDPTMTLRQDSKLFGPYGLGAFSQYCTE